MMAAKFKGKRLPIPYPLTPERKALQKQLENRQWIEDNWEELFGKYAGRIILVKDKKIVEVTGTYDDMSKIIREKGYNLDEVCVLGFPPAGSKLTVVWPEMLPPKAREILERKEYVWLEHLK